MNKNKVMLVEDDRELSAMIAQFLSTEGYAVRCVSNGLEAVASVTELSPDLVILDVMLPGLDGIEVCRRIREGFNGPVLMLTAKDDDMVEVTSLNSGASGYLTKPVRPHVLLAHIKAQLRTGPEPKEHLLPSDNAIQVQDLVIDQAALSATINQRQFDLSHAEFSLLLFLCERAGQIISRDSLYDNLKRIPFDGVDRAMDMQISVLRRKMGDDVPPYKYIKTIRGKGYMLAIR